MTIFADTTLVNHRRWHMTHAANPDFSGYIVTRSYSGEDRWCSVRGGDGQWDEETETYPEIGSFWWYEPFPRVLSLRWVEENVTHAMIAEYCIWADMKLLMPAEMPHPDNGVILAECRWDNGSGRGDCVIIGWGRDDYFSFF